MKTWRRVLLACLLSLAAAAAAGAEPDATAPRHARALKPSDISVPSELGDVIETHQPASDTRPVIIHIQEAHSNYEAQAHLADILDRLVKQYGLKLVLVEGGEGDVSLHYLRDYGPPESRKQVAEKYLKAGVLSGEEYLDVVSDYPLLLWGVEQNDLYQENVQAFLEAESLRDTLRPVVAEVRETVEALRPSLSDPTLDHLHEQIRAFEGGTLDLARYADLLSGLALQQGISKDEFPNLVAFLYIRSLEEGIHPSTVHEEQAIFLERLSRQLAPSRLDDLKANIRKVREGTLSQDAFYLSLEQLAASSRIPLDEYPALSHYLTYLKVSGRVTSSALAEELDRLAARLRTSLASSPERQSLDAVVEQLDLIDKLLDLRLSPAEYERLQALRVGERMPGWAAFLNAQLAAHALPARSFTRLDELSAALPKLQRFYEAAERRDAVLVERAMAKLAETKEPIAVLITGGFHAPRITQLLKARGVGVAVVVPRVSQATDERLYRAVLKYKSGYGNFDDVQAALGRLATRHEAPASERSVR